MAGLVLLMVGGCSSDDPTSTDPDLFIDPPDNPNALMVRFERAYEEMNINEYEVILHADFKFIFIDYAEVWYRQTDIQSTANMFNFNPGQNPDGSYRAPVQNIAINTLIRQTPWEDVPANDPDFPDSEKALYQVQIVFTLEGGENTITVESDQLFFVKPEEIDQGDGTMRTRYFLYGQRDLVGGGRGDEGRSWGAIKSLYLTGP